MVIASRVTAAGASRVAFWVDSRDVEVADDGAMLLEVLRDRLGIRSAKDGCSPQGQCGCCTVLVDGHPRVSCVTPVRRLAGRQVTTLAGLPDDVRDHWAGAFTDTGASQCGFCTPGIIMRLAALPGPLTEAAVEAALVAHLCRCTGWRTIVDAAVSGRASAERDPHAAVSGRVSGERDRHAAVSGRASGERDRHAAVSGRVSGERDPHAAARRAQLEGGAVQVVGPNVALGLGGFADDLAPPDALVAVPGPDGWVVGATLSEARAAAGKVQGRRTTASLSWPLSLPAGDWDRTLRTTWVEPGYLEPDAAWCLPGGEPVGPLANGGAFGGKVDSPVMAAARRLADEHGRPVRVLLAREDVVRMGPKRPPIAAGIRRDGTGVIHVVRTPGIVAAIHSVGPGLEVEEVDVIGPPTSAALRGAGWVEVAVLLAAVEPSEGRIVTSPSGGWATAVVASDGSVSVRVAAGPALDETVLRSYCVGAAHQALGWVTTEGIAVDGEGVPQDLTIRSFGILQARDMPEVTVEIVASADDLPEPVNGSDAVFAAVAAAVWRHRGFPGDWPTKPIDR